MKCFNHPERDAVAICKSCNKGLCKECAVEIDATIACKGKCEEKVAFLNKVVHGNKSVYNKTAKSYYTMAFVQGIFGLSFIGFGAYSEFPELNPFLFMVGGIMILACVLTIFSGRRFGKSQ
ncbi:hypothetical protein IRP63_14205 (plasmid) [Clostridium botulinum]|uniref:B box-type domain-containing protein n=1 Tax=Clostridium botulinum C/D str. DC5 TaxID=1443128 RepID=A0A0A0IND0_CLOBO|nr:hypothetical protein [Clostridium botulinum]KEH99754.1 hypothetical protein Z952_p0079 [Clostridium botulinum C/D str. BKT75002]KEI05232.1 hypothetical protein Z954_0079 [Clostridium botulinum C/D str. BKT2873]KGM93542.1 hypothetical protein Z955_14890 [Clostridium botulinum C/D str. DC5]KGN01652.1 hypothetical protein Z955_01095 [Clostridium botulinum C/D str. DC5]KOC56858.1 hypothetical protein ADU89_01275 [Clostridium botulinum]